MLESTMIANLKIQIYTTNDAPRNSANKEK